MPRASWPAARAKPRPGMPGWRLGRERDSGKARPGDRRARKGQQQTPTRASRTDSGAAPTNGRSRRRSRRRRAEGGRCDTQRAAAAPAKGQRTSAEETSRREDQARQGQGRAKAGQGMAAFGPARVVRVRGRVARRPKACACDVDMMMRVRVRGCVCRVV